WYQACTMMSRPLTGISDDVATLDRDQRSVVRHAVLGIGLVARDLVVAAELERAVLAEVVDTVGTALGTELVVARGQAATTELVGEHDLGAVVVERGRVPEREVLVVLHPPIRR